jgi:hypothetical protein
LIKVFGIRRSISEKAEEQLAAIGGTILRVAAGARTGVRMIGAVGAFLTQVGSDEFLRSTTVTQSTGLHCRDITSSALYQQIANLLHLRRHLCRHLQPLICSIGYFL